MDASEISHAAGERFPVVVRVNYSIFGSIISARSSSLGYFSDAEGDLSCKAEEMRDYIYLESSRCVFFCSMSKLAHTF